MIQKNDQKGLLASKDRILKAAIETPGYLNSEAVRRIITILLDEYRLDALKFGRHILAQSSPRLDSDGYSLLHLLLYPTIFDFDAAKLVATKVSERASPLKPTTLNMSKDPLMPPVPTMQANTTKTVRGVLPYTTASGKELMDLHRHVRSLKQALSMVDLEM